MTTPMARAIQSAKISDLIIRDRVVSVYSDLFFQFKYDLLDRYWRKFKGKPWGGGFDPVNRAAELEKAFASIKKQIASLDPIQAKLLSKGPLVSLGEAVPNIEFKIFKKMNGDLDSILYEDLRKNIVAMAGQAPSWVKALEPNLIKKYDSYLKKGSLIEEKLRQGRYLKGGIYSPHARMFEKTRHQLLVGLERGSSPWDTIADIERRVWGIDVVKTGTNRGALTWVKRLLRTEYQYAHNSAKHDIGRNDTYINGYYIFVEAMACENCISIYGSPGSEHLFFYEKDGELTPPNETHPNCHCTITRFHWAKPKI